MQRSLKIKQFSDLFFGKINLTPRLKYKLRKFLSSAGYYDAEALAIFITIHIILSILMLLIALVVARAFDLSVILTLLAMISSLILSLLAPTFILFCWREKTQRAILHSMLSILELLYLCSEFGSSIDQTIKLVTEVMYIVKKDRLANIMNKLSVDLVRLSSRQEAWYNLQRQLPTDDFNSVIRLLIKSDLYGVSMIEEQRKQLDSIRELKVERLEKEANNARFAANMVTTIAMIVIFMVLSLLFVQAEIKSSSAGSLLDNTGNILNIGK